MSRCELYRVRKTFGHEMGLSCAFRQWRAESHCRFLHGYALSFSFEFSAIALDDRNWVMDFGGMKELREALKQEYDHTTIVAFDDPLLETYRSMSKAGLIQMRNRVSVGCEAFALHAYDMAEFILMPQLKREHFNGTNMKGYVDLVSCTVSEHPANSATYIGKADV